MRYLYILLFCTVAFSQSKPLSFEIDKLTAIDSIDKRCYTLSYHIKNVSDKTVSFVLNGTTLIPINAGSQSEKMYFKLFENDKSIEMSNIIDNGFIQKTIKGKVTTTDRLTLEEVQKKSLEETQQYYEELRRKSILENIITLKPGETKEYQAYFSWNKERYRKQGEFEYYISETNPHFLQLDFNLMLESFADKLTAEEYKTLSSNPNIIKGWYTSNKVEINFRE